MQNYEKQESISVGCEVPTFLIQVVFPTENPLDKDAPLDRDLSGQRPPWTESPLGQEPPWTRPSLDRDPLPLQTNACETIT